MPRIKARTKITRQQYDAACEAFRRFGKQYSAVGRAIGCTRQFAAQLYEDGVAYGDGWGEPISDLLAYEQQLARARMQEAKARALAGEVEAQADQLKRQGEVEEAARKLEEERHQHENEVRAQVDREERGRVQVLANQDATEQMDVELRATRALQNNAMMGMAISGQLLRGAVHLGRQLDGLLKDMSRHPVMVRERTKDGHQRPQDLVERDRQKETLARVKAGVSVMTAISRITKDLAEVHRHGMVLERLRMGQPAELASPLAAYDRMSEAELLASAQESQEAFHRAMERARMLPAPPIDPEAEADTLTNASAKVLPQDQPDAGDMPKRKRKPAPADEEPGPEEEEDEGLPHAEPEGDEEELLPLDDEPRLPGDDDPEEGDEEPDPRDDPEGEPDEEDEERDDE